MVGAAEAKGAGFGGVVENLLKVLVTGAGGQLGSDVCDALSGVLPPGAGSGLPMSARIKEMRYCDVVAAGHAQLDVTNRASVLDAIEAIRPDVIVHAGAWTRVDDCEQYPDRAFAVNALGTRNLAEGARRYSAHMLYVSTDYVFDGTLDRPYVEWDVPCPISVYGRSKLGGEMEIGREWAIVRTSWLCGVRGWNFVKAIVSAYREGKPLKVVDDQKGSPTVTADLACMVAYLATERLPGIYHITNQGEASWWEVARLIVSELGGDPDLVQPISTAQLDPPRVAPRPANSVLDNVALRAGGIALATRWEDGMARLVTELKEGF
ncbi:MAG: dTDP-4-dehydrorhamnose reductase [Actinobacteria bacterium]|jgi:dTDP-4-dehydrorhamnose reductase|nr:dTDP-4-dehydrorhamnose reductase [Actinomycetota bacterium]